MMNYIEEETFFKCLAWLFPALSGILVTVSVGEGYFFNDDKKSPFYSYCAKIPISKQEKADLPSHLFLSLCVISFCLVGLGFHIAIFARQKQLENRQNSGGNLVVSYNKETGARTARRINPRTL